jgi:multidrug efflux pump subunit AcrB
MVRGRGYAKSVADFESIVVSASESGRPIRIRDIGHVTVGPDLRRGVADLDGAGEVVSGIVVMRQGENAVDVIDRLTGSLPPWTRFRQRGSRSAGFSRAQRSSMSTRPAAGASSCPG